MSFNVRDIYPVVSSLTLDPTAQAISLTGKPSGVQGPTEGQIWYDSVNKNVYAFIGGSVVSLYTQVVEINPTASQTPAVASQPSSSALMSYVFPAGSLNQLNRNLDLYVSGYYSTASGQTPTITLYVTLADGTNTRTVLTWTTGATTASASNMPFNFDGTIFTYATGSSGTVLAHGTLNLTLGSTAGASLNSYNDVNHAASSSLDLTKAITLTVNATMSTNASGNSLSEDVLWVAFN